MLLPGIYFRRGTIDDRRSDGQAYIKAGFAIVTDLGVVEVQKEFPGSDIFQAMLALYEWVAGTAATKNIAVSPIIAGDIAEQLGVMRTYVANHTVIPAG